LKRQAVQGGKEIKRKRGDCGRNDGRIMRQKRSIDKIITTNQSINGRRRRRKERKKEKKEKKERS